MEKELWICFTQRETQVPLPTWPPRWVGFWAPLDCWQAEVSAPCVVSAKTGLPAGMVSLLLIWAFLAFSHSFMRSEHLSSPTSALTAANEDTLLPMFSGWHETATAQKVSLLFFAPPFMWLCGVSFFSKRPLCFRQLVFAGFGPHFI